MACLWPKLHQIQPLNASARLHQKTVHMADSRSVGSWACRWKTDMSRISSATVPAPKASQYSVGKWSNSAASVGLLIEWASDSTQQNSFGRVREQQSMFTRQWRNHRS